MQFWRAERGVQPSLSPHHHDDLDRGGLDQISGLPQQVEVTVHDPPDEEDGQDSSHLHHTPHHPPVSESNEEWQGLGGSVLLVGESSPPPLPTPVEEGDESRLLHVAEENDQARRRPLHSCDGEDQPCADTGRMVNTEGRNDGCRSGNGVDGSGKGEGREKGDDQQVSHSAVVVKSESVQTPETETETGSREGGVRPEPSEDAETHLKVKSGCQEGRENVSPPSTSEHQHWDNNSSSSLLSLPQGTSRYGGTKLCSSLSLDRRSNLEESVLQQTRREERTEREIHTEEHDWRGDDLLKSEVYLFPVSNSPLDVITMLTRLACFTGSLLRNLTPKLRHGAVPDLDTFRVSGSPPEMCFICP